MRYNSGDAQPTAFVIAQIVVRQASGKAGSGREIRVERGRREFDSDSRDTVFHGLVSEHAPLRLSLFEKYNRLALKGVGIACEISPIFASGKLQAAELARDCV